MKSEIIEEYLKTAQSKGWDKTVIPKTAKNRNESTDYQDKIRALYGLEIKTNDKSEDILDQAHPKAVFIAPAYDAVNGLVENLKERQDIMAGIARRQPTGQLDGHKYANENLVHELLKIGFELNQHPELQKESDALLNDVVADLESQTLKKEAGWWGVAGGLLVVPILYNAFHSNLIGTYSRVSIPTGAKDAITAINEVKSLMDIHVRRRCETQVEVIRKFVDLTNDMVPLVENLPKESADDILRGSAQKAISQQDRENIKALNEYAKHCRAMIDFTKATVEELKVATINKPVGDSDWWNATEQVTSKLMGRGRTYLYAINTLLSLITSIEVFLDKTSKTFRAEQESVSSKEAESVFSKKETAQPEAKPAYRISEPTVSPAATAKPVSPTPTTVKAPTSSAALTDEDILGKGW